MIDETQQNIIILPLTKRFIVTGNVDKFIYFFRYPYLLNAEFQRIMTMRINGGEIP